MDVIAEVEVVYWEVYERRQLPPPITHPLESFQLYDEDRRWSERLERLLMGPLRPTLPTVYLIRELLNIMEFLQAFLQAHDLLFNIVIKLENGRMAHRLIRRRVILPFNHFRIPLNSNMTNLQKVWYVSIGVWLNDASTAFIYPIASRARISLTVDHLQDERPEAFAFSVFIVKLFPIWVIPPLVCGVQILAVLF